jgi:hypothetical protein
MATDTITVKLKLEADFKTIQAIRQTLSTSQAKVSLGQVLAEQAKTVLAGYDLGQFELIPSIKVSRYSETKKGSRVPPPVVSNDILTLWDYELNREIETLEVEGPDWFDWLEKADTQSFRYESQAGVFTAIKENRQGRLVWYAHRRIGGKLKRRYLGKSENLTTQKLSETARKLGQTRNSVSLASETER